MTNGTPGTSMSIKLLITIIANYNNNDTSKGRMIPSWLVLVELESENRKTTLEEENSWKLARTVQELAITQT